MTGGIDPPIALLLRSKRMRLYNEVKSNWISVPERFTLDRFIS